MNHVRLLVFVVLATATCSALAQPAKKPPRITLGGIAGIVVEQQTQLDEFNKKLTEAESRLAQAVEACKKQAESVVQAPHQSPAPPATAACDHSKLEAQIKKLRDENNRIKRRIAILENAMKELMVAQKRGEKHRKQLAEALAAVQKEFPQQIAGLSSAIAKLELGIGSVEKAVSGMTGQLDEAIRVLRKYEPRIASLETKASESETAIARLEKRSDDYQRRIHLNITGEGWGTRAGFGGGGGVSLQLPLAGGTCAVLMGGGLGYDKQGLAGYAQMLVQCSVVRFGGLGLFGESKTIGGTVGLGHSFKHFTFFADGGAGAEKLADGVPFRITWLAKAGLGVRF